MPGRAGGDTLIKRDGALIRLRHNPAQMGPSAGAANFCQRFNKCLRHPLATGSRTHEKIIQGAAAPGKDNFRQVKKQREAQRFISPEGQ